MRLVLCSVTLALLACAARAGDNVPGPGEIGVYGQVVSVDTVRGTFTLNVSQFRTPGGKACLNPPKPKVVKVGAQAVMSFLGEAPGGRGPVASDCRVGRRAYAVGVDSGAGSVLTARWVALGTPSAPPAVPPAVAGQSAPTQQSPAPAASRRQGRDFRSPWFLSGVALLALSALGGILLARRYLHW